MASESDYQPSSNPQITSSAQKSAALRFGRYEVACREDGSPFELGRGGMGVTYKAIDPELRRSVVLKVISPLLLGNDPQARARFQREARSAAGVHHPHIATIFDIGEERGEDYYVMEFIAGEDLLTRLKRDGPLDALPALRIARQVAEALDAAWQQNIVHRDIKPANLMIARQSAAREAREGPMVKVVDFGLAKALKVAGAAEGNISVMLTGAAQAVFSPAYASPEQIEDGELDIRSDIYSLGITLWQMLTGEPTFGNTSRQRTIVGHLSKEPPFNDLRAVHVPESVIELLGKLLEKIPADRPSTPEAVVEEIERLLAGGALEPPRLPEHQAPGLARPQPPPEPPPPGAADPAAVTDVFTGADAFPLVEVLRCRGALPADEVLLLLDVLAPQVDAMRLENAAALPNLEPRLVRVGFEKPPVNWETLPAQPVDSWPPFVLRLESAIATAPQQTPDQTMSPDQTMLPGNGAFQAEDAIQAVGALVYELLDGRPPPLLRYRPQGAINEAANAVLRRSLEDGAYFRTAEAFAQAMRVALKSDEAPERREAAPPPAIAGEPETEADGATVQVRRELPPAAKKTPAAPPVRREASPAVTGQAAAWELDSVTTPVRREPPPAVTGSADLLVTGQGAPDNSAASPVARRESPPAVEETPVPPVKVLPPAAPPVPAIARASGGNAMAAVPPGPNRRPLLVFAGVTVGVLAVGLALMLLLWPKPHAPEEKPPDKPAPTPDVAQAQQVAQQARQAQIDQLLDQADSAYFAGDWQKTIEKCGAALALSPDALPAYARRGWAYSRSGDAPRAAEDWGKAAAISPAPSARAYNGRGLAYDGLGQKDKTLADYNKAIELDPKFVQAYSNRGIIYRALGQNEQAMADYNKAIELDPKFARGYNSRGTLYKALGQNGLALEDYNKAIELDPKFAQAYSNRGNVYNDLGQKDQALAEYAKAIKLDPKLTQAYNSQGVIYADLGQKDKALANYSKAIELDPRNTYAYTNRGTVYKALNDIDKALEDYNKAIELDPKFVPAYRNRSLLYAQLNDLLRSKADMAKVNELTRGNNQ